jgi:hypothetical protein
VVVVGVAVVVVVVVELVELVVVVVGSPEVVVVVVVGTKLQHSYACISFHLPTFGLFFLRTRLPATTLPDPSYRTYAFKFLLVVLILNFYL